MTQVHEKLLWRVLLHDLLTRCHPLLVADELREVGDANVGRVHADSFERRNERRYPLLHVQIEL